MSHRIVQHLELFCMRRRDKEAIPSSIAGLPVEEDIAEGSDAEGSGDGGLRAGSDCSSLHGDEDLLHLRHLARHPRAQ